jgi:NADH-quinone oxidoreductase subunit N
MSLEYFVFERLFFIEYYFLIGILAFAGFFLISANDFIIFYFAIELQALVLYTLAALKRYNVFSAESGLKYFILGAFSSGLLLFGVSFFYGFLGITSFYDIKFLLLKWLDGDFNYAFTMSLVFIFSALLFKLAAAPFHIWIPDVYEGAPTAIVLIFALLPKLVIFGFLVRFYILTMQGVGALWYLVFFFSGLLSVLWGTFAALDQVNIKRLYAYSAVVNVGYLLSAFAYGTVDGFVVSINYLVTYLTTTFLVFLVILLFRKVEGAQKIKFFADYQAYLSYNPTTALLVAFVFFSLAGIPPLAGFFIKFFLLRTLFVYEFLSGPTVYIVLITTVVSAFYYIRIVRFAFFNSKRIPTFFINISWAHSFLFVLVNFFLIFFLSIQPFTMLLFSNLITDLFL